MPLQRRKAEAMREFIKVSRALPILPLLVLSLLLTGCPSTKPSGYYSGTSSWPDVTSTGRPNASGNYYTIRKGDTLYSIAKRNKINWYEILEANPSLDPHDLPVGQSILIPGVSSPKPPIQQPAPPTPPEPAYAVSPGYDGPIRAESNFVWPVKGTVIAHFGKSVSWRMWTANHGIDIRAREGQALVAAKSGRVNTFSEVPGFGRAVVLEHTDGTTTFYGHLDRVLVKHGRWVKQGEDIGIVGSSGASSGTELHFRILRNGAYANPLLYLPD